jgi:hypothetical protein
MIETSKTESSRKPHPHKCPAHNMWMRKGVCEVCRLNEDILRKHREDSHGSNKQEVIIKNV